jgi:hypothetical protein
MPTPTIQYPELTKGKYYVVYLKGKPGNYPSASNPLGYHTIRFVKRYADKASVRLFNPYTNRWSIRKRIPMTAFGPDPQPVKRRRPKPRLQKETA